jgi:hypothetical protein
MGLLAFVILAAAPGCLLSFAFTCEGLGGRTRLWLGIALSPAVAAAQLVLLKAFGASFPTAAWIVLVADAVALLLVAWRARFAPSDRAQLFGTAVTLVLVALPALVLWVSWHAWPSFPYFSWHSMHHADLCYSVTRPGIIPEDANMSGFGTKYPFFAHYYWALLSWFVDTPPNVVYLATNLLWLFVTGLLAYEAALAFGCRPPAAAATGAVLFCGNSFVAMAAETSRLLMVRFGSGDALWASVGNLRIFGPWKPLLADPRAVTFLQKYFDFNIMPFALALVLGLFVVGGGMLRNGYQRSWGALLAAVLAGVGLLYPILAPPVYVTAGLIVLASAFSGASRGQVLRRVVGRGLWVGGAALAVAAIWGYLLTGREGPALAMPSRSVVALKSVRALAAFGLPLLLVSPLFLSRRTRRDPTILLLGGITAAVVILYVGAPLYAGNEYKWVFLGWSAFTLLAARALEALGLGWRGVLPVALVLALAAAEMNRTLFEQMGIRHVMSYPYPEVAWNGFWMDLRKPETAAAWLTVLREKTPPDTILVAPGTDLPLYAFGRRNEYLALDDEGPIGRIGYAHRMEVIIPGVHGLPGRAYTERRQRVRVLYGKEVSPWYPGVLESIRAGGRPVAIRFDSRDQPFLAWLRGQGIGRPLLDDDDGVLWFLPAERR